MKYCPGCRMKVGGSFEQCPLCQNDLQGDNEDNIFPFSVKLNKQSFLYKMQLFLCLAFLVISLTLDFLMDLRMEKHWSLLVFVWVIGIQFCIRSLIKKHSTISRVMSYIMFGNVVFLAYTFMFFDIFDIYLQYVLPNICMVNLMVHCVLSMTDKAKNAMVYYLVSVLFNITVNGIIYADRKEKLLIWSICLMISVISFVGIVIFKGKKVIAEIQKRLNF